MLSYLNLCINVGRLYFDSVEKVTVIPQSGMIF